MMATRNSEAIQIEGIKMLTLLLSLPSKEDPTYGRMVKLRSQFEKSHGYALLLSIFEGCNASVGLCHALMDLLVGKHAPQRTAIKLSTRKRSSTDDGDIVTMMNPDALKILLHVLKKSAFDTPGLTSSVLRNVERMLSPDMQGVEAAADVAVKNLEALLACQQEKHVLVKKIH